MPESHLERPEFMFRPSSRALLDQVANSSLFLGRYLACQSYLGIFDAELGV